MSKASKQALTEHTRVHGSRLPVVPPDSVVFSGKAPSYAGVACLPMRVQRTGKQKREAFYSITKMCTLF